MKLDLECVRDVLLYLEKQDNANKTLGGGLEFVPITTQSICDAVPGYDDKTVLYTLFNLEKARLIDAALLEVDITVDILFVRNVTYEGHQLIGHMQNDAQWEKAKKALSVVGVFSLEMIKAVLSGLASGAIAQLV